MKVYKNKNGQAMPDKSQFFGPEAFQKINQTEIRWLGNASMMINSRGTNIMIDPLLEGFDMPLLIEMPILPKDIPSLDGLLITHIDNDHFSRATCIDLLSVCQSYHAPKYVAQVMQEEGIPGVGHNIHESFMIDDVKITLTPTCHNWQKDSAKYNYREWKEEDYCGYWLETADGTIWLPGDSKLLDAHLKMPQPDVIFFDFCDNEWHITLEGAITLANTYPQADLVCIHWGCVDAPDFSPFNGNPENLLDKVINPERIKVLAPGEPIVLTRKEKQ
ncbi:MBL fold metallo-hydrolase [Candidatus Stoquefichus sp. SB1]|uniref:MBL fold metallo-hydrolase n=1 Tax=Candidatus Stoquefichus sp. SB1 TaxID=1658109 RepID=UPI00067EDA68|nr:MBL fold metallo-hydrolase [Candidatus Stoquefichus sp. SB1]